MAIPDFQTLMRPILAAHEVQPEWGRTALRDYLVEEFGLSPEERNELLPSGRQRKFDNRIGWSTTHLYQAGLLERPRRGVTRLTERGREVLRRHPERVDMSVLNEFPDYRDFRSRTRDDREPDEGAPTLMGEPQADNATTTPEEAVETAFEQLNASLGQTLLRQLLDSSPEFFEQVVVDVLVAMGYGGSRKEAGERLGQTGDMGIDGVIREDVLGLDAIYLQAKRWDPERPIGRPDVQAFVGAMQGARAAKGVFITTSRFSREAREYANSVTPRVVLIGGKQITDLMIAHNVGVTVRQTYELKRLDTDYFDEES